MNSIIAKELATNKSISTDKLVTKHRYDDFVAQLMRGPILIAASGAARKDGETRCVGCGAEECAGCSIGGPAFEVTRAIVRLEFAGYEPAGNNHARLVPNVRRVLSCGHSEVERASSVYWEKRPKRTTYCHECSKAKEAEAWKTFVPDAEWSWLIWPPRSL